MSDRLDPMDDLRRQFVAAAEREARPVRRWWTTPRLRATAILVALLATGAIAEAVNLISTGDPVPRHGEAAKHFGVAAGGGRIALTSRDPERKLPFAVVTYRASGQPCALAGQLRGDELGELRGGAFHSFESRLGGACGRLGPSAFFASSVDVDGRSLVFGRARKDVAEMVARQHGQVARARTGPGGAFLFVFEGGLRLSGLRLEAYRANGKRVP